MYHFRTKEALMLGLVDHVADEWRREMDAWLTSPFQGSTMRERAGIYVEACVTREPDPADIVMLTDPRLRQEPPPRWAERISTWFVGLEQPGAPSSADTSQLFGQARGRRLVRRRHRHQHPHTRRTGRDPRGRV